MSPETPQDGETVKLEHPFKYGEEQVNEIFLVRPTAKHVRGINMGLLAQGDGSTTLQLIQNLSGEPPSKVDLIDMRDLNKINAVITDFLE